MMAETYNIKNEYWQVKATGEIMEVPKAERSMEWIKAYRQVRLLHHPESDCLMVEDIGTCCSWLDDPLVVELTLEEYKYWKMIYDNPEI